MHELQNCIAPRLPCYPLKFHIPIRAFAKYSLRFYSLVKFSPGALAICILRKTEARRQLRLKLLNRMSMSHVFFFFFIFFLSFAKRAVTEKNGVFVGKKLILL